MEGEVDRDDLRFRLDWPTDDNVNAPEDALTDFSFEWDTGDDGGLAAAGEPQDSEPVEIVPSVVDTAFLDSSEALDAVRRSLDDNNDALRQLSEAVYELASNVRLLVDEVDTLTKTGISSGESGDGGVTAKAMVTMSAEVTTALEQLADELHATRGDLSGMMDDVVAAAGGESGLDVGDKPRVIVEIDRVHSELQALKRRLPVRGRELDPAEIAEIVAEHLLAVLTTQPVVEQPKRRVQRVTEREEAPPRAPARSSARRQRPLRAD
jgi:hypothetical protein